MFSGVGRRLALFNALVVIVVIALTGVATYLLLLRQLNAEVDNSLMASAAQTVRSLRNAEPAASAVPSKGSKDDEHEHDADILASGDTIVFAIDAAGRVTYNPRNISVPKIPNTASLQRALAGDDDIRSLSVADVGPMRVASVPITSDHRALGAVQVLRSLSRHDAELATLRWMTLLGAALGAAIAVPAGLLLARRAMRPIDVAFARQRMFIADASHELRTPLTLIRANAETAGQDPAGPISSIEPELASILGEVDRTDRLVDDLLTLARVDAGVLELRRDLVNVSELVREVYNEMLPLANQRNINLHLDAPTPSVILIDPDRIRQVLRIVIDNALKYTPSQRDVMLAVALGKGEVSVIVRDGGPGISEKDLSHLFDRFYRVDQARSRTLGGTGLGLPIARALVEAHGGTITVTSALGRGTTVTISLPILAKVSD